MFVLLSCRDLYRISCVFLLNINSLTEQGEIVTIFPVTWLVGGDIQLQGRYSR